MTLSIPTLVFVAVLVTVAVAIAYMVGLTDGYRAATKKEFGRRD